MLAYPYVERNTMPAKNEAALKAEIRRRGGAVKVVTIHPDPSNKNMYARVYVVRKKGPRGGKTIRGPITSAQTGTAGDVSPRR
jgi:hypothetical protein